MREKVSYEELQQKAKALEKHVRKLKAVERELRESEQKYRDLYENAPIAYFSISSNDGSILRFNSEAMHLLGYKKETLAQMKVFDLYADTLHGASKAKALFERFQAGESIRNEELQMKRMDGQTIWVNHNVAPVNDPGGEVVESRSMVIDISMCKQTEQALQEREKELETKAKELEEVNTALRVLLKRKDEDKTELEGKILLNVKELIEPYLDKLKKSKLDGRQKSYFNIVHTNLNDIISPFAKKLASQYLKLTPKEIQIADLIKHGKTTKDIADLLNLSPQTIESHRKNIRIKLGIKENRANLRTHLLSLT